MSDYLVYTGNFYPHKNVSLLIQAAQKLKIKTYLIGKYSTFVTRLPVSDYVEFKHTLSDTQIQEYYHHALCFIMPSFLEGFGLPGLEAMAAGTPVIAANSSCLPEIYGNAALYFDPHSLASLISQINLIRSDPDIRTKLISKGHLQAQKYSWITTAKQTWHIYQEELKK